MLLKKDEMVYRPIYYVSKVLLDPETHYPLVEKLALALVMALRKLRPYFQAHSITILTNQPLRQILQKPEHSGRLVKWAVELGGYEITFQPQ